MRTQPASVADARPPAKVIHSGKTYHQFMAASAPDRKVRENFQQLVFRLMRSPGTILDFGAGTGLDAKSYAAHGYKVLVYEPSEANLAYLKQYCQNEIATGEITIVDFSVAASAEMIVADFAVLNLIADHERLFAEFADLVGPGGLVLASVLNPFFVGDARYSWWWNNLPALLKSGQYAVAGEFGHVYRVTPSVLRRAARPHFERVASVPGWIRLAVSPYVFLLFQKQ